MNKFIILALLALSGAAHAGSSEQMTINLSVYDQNNTLIKGELTALVSEERVDGITVVDISSADRLAPLAVTTNVGGVVKNLYILPNSQDFHLSAKLICKLVNPKLTYAAVAASTASVHHNAGRNMDYVHALVTEKNGYFSLVNLNQSMKGAAPVAIRCADQAVDLQAGGNPM